MGIPLNSNFDVNAALPLDARLLAADLTTRDAIPSGVRYLGMTVFVISEGMNYQLIGGITNPDWVEFAGGGGGSGSGSLNTVFQDDMESSEVTDYFTTDIIAFNLNSGGLIHGEMCMSIVHGEATGGPGDDDPGTVARAYALQPKFRGQKLTFNLAVISQASVGCLLVSINDVTNSDPLIVDVPLDYDPDGKVYLCDIPFESPVTCEAIEYVITVMPDSVAGNMSFIDDIYVEVQPLGNIDTSAYITYLFGAEDIDDSIRINTTDGTFTLEKRVAGVWTFMGSFAV